MIITCASSKGGVGKSTTAASLAGAYAFIGAAVHIVDLDNNRTVSRWFNDPATCPKLITVSTPDPQDLTDHLQELGRTIAPEVILIDVAGTYERALTVAVARAHLTIIPATLTEADIFEAARIASHIRQIFNSFGREPLYRLLLTRVQPLTSSAQKHAAREIARLKLPMFNTALVHRAAYEEIGLSGLPPHYADASRPPVAKALVELEGLREEVSALVDAKSQSEAVQSSPVARKAVAS